MVDKICGKRGVLSLEWNSECVIEGESGEVGDKLLEFLPLREKATGRPRVLTKSAIPTIHSRTTF